nr:MarR family transcriptional regulator [Xanthomonadales bacterium]
AALADPALHRMLALLDALRSGRARERALAASLLQEEMERADAS